MKANTRNLLLFSITVSFLSFAIFGVSIADDEKPAKEKTKCHCKWQLFNMNATHETNFNVQEYEYMAIIIRNKEVGSVRFNDARPHELKMSHGMVRSLSLKWKADSVVDRDSEITLKYKFTLYRRPLILLP